MRLGMASLDIVPQSVHQDTALSSLEGEHLGLLMQPWFPERERADASLRHVFGLPV